MMETIRGFWASIRHGVHTMRGCYVSRHGQRKEGEGYVATPSWVRALMVYVAGPAFGFEQYWFCWVCYERGWPEWPGRVATWIHCTMDDLTERWQTPIRWNAPDSGMPGEVGFWSVSNGSHERDNTRIFVSGASYLSVPPGVERSLPVR